MTKRAVSRAGKGLSVPLGTPERRALALVGAIYDGVAEPAQWHDALGSLCDMFTGTLALLARHDDQGADLSLLASWGDPDLIASLANSYMDENPFVAAIPHMEVDVPMTTASIYEIEGPEFRSLWLASALNRDWVMPNAFNDFVWLPVIKGSDRHGSLLMVTDRARPEISGDDLATFAEFAPHIRRAIAVSDMLAVERQRTGLFAEALGRLNCAVLIVDAAMTLLYANPAGEEAIRARGIVSTIRAKVTLQWPLARQAVERAVHFGERSEFALGTLGIGAPLSPAQGAAVAHVLPLARGDLSMRVDSRAAAAIYISWPDADSSAGIDAIAALFGLTAAEKRVAGQVAQGLSRPAIAEANGVLPGTVKTHLAAIFDKTGVSDQRRLAALLRDLTLPVRMD